MEIVRRLRTQTEEFWRDEYQVSDDDLDLVVGIILDAGRPQPLASLALEVILRRCKREEDVMVQQSLKGRIYRPLEVYGVGEQLVFTAKDMAVGTIEGLRPGHNPKFGSFNVIRVSFADEELEFASSFDQPHPLNRPVEELLIGEQAEMSESEMVRLFEHHVAVKLESKLAESDDFVRFDGTWFLHELLPDIHIGYLNLAEAMIYEAGHPLVARDMLADLEIGATASEETQLFALNHALGEDERFDNVGTSESPIWYLCALEPEATSGRPEVLVPAFAASGGEYLGLTMLDLIDEIGDELDDVPSTVFRQVSEIRFELTFPHWVAGTMPATQQFLRLLPVASGRHYPITLVDSSRDKRFDVWVLPDERYVAGLGDWYRSVGLVIGAQVTVKPIDDLGTFSIAVATNRGRRSEWVRSASVVGGSLRLQMQRATIPVRVDRSMMIDVPDIDSVVELRRQADSMAMPLGALVRGAFAELAKLSGRGLVHAKSLYSAINLMRRTGAVSVFAELTRNACFDPVGDGQWAYDKSLDGKVYHTADEMRDRPLSNRDDLIKDQVIQYVGR